MYKKIILAILIAILSFGGVSAGTSSKLTENKKIQIKLILKNYYNKYESKYGKEKSIKIFKKIYDKIIRLEENKNNLNKKNLLEILKKDIFEIILKNQDNTEVIKKDFGNGVYITQNKYGIGYTNVYAFGKKILSDYTCYPFSLSCFNDLGVSEKNIFNLTQIKIKKFQKNILEGYKITDEGIENKKIGIKILVKYGYESANSIILDVKNKKVYQKKYLQEISKLRAGKSGIYFLDGGRGPTTLYMISKNNEFVKLYTDEDTNLSLYNYELMTNKRVKLFYSNGGEKIINIK